VSPSQRHPSDCLSFFGCREKILLANEFVPHSSVYYRPMRELILRVAKFPPRSTDLVLATTLSMIEVATLLAYQSKLHPFPLAVVLVIAQNAPLVFRRDHPITTFVIIGGARIAYDVLGFGFAPLPLGPAIAVFTVAATCSPKVRTVVGVLLAAGIGISQFSAGHNQPYDITMAVLVFITAWMAGVVSRTRHSYLEEVEDRARQAERNRERDVARAADEERTRIARELHDVVAHHVSLIAVQAEAVASLLPDRPGEASRSIDVIGTTARQALTELRRLLGVLRSPSQSPEKAPAPSLKELHVVLDQVRSAGLRVDFSVVGTPCALAPSIDLTAYRIVQEALTNVVRHAARTSKVEVIVSYEPSFVSVHIADSGPGSFISPAPACVQTPSKPIPASSPGFGLAGIAERVASCDGNLTVGPTDIGGFAVRARLPIR